MPSTKPQEVNKSTTLNKLTPTTHPSQPHHTPISFSHIIEADHTSISRLAAQTTKPNLSLPHRLTALTTLLVRLVRHDISEELVMRPAFTQYMGDEGASFATQDRLDHADLKRRLVALYEGVVEKGEEAVDEAELLSQVRGLSGEMAGHMREESGVMLPRLERVLGRKVSLGLGERYARTLVLTPDVRVGDGGGCFGGVMEYVRADIGVFRGILERLELRAGTGGEGEGDGGYLRGRVREELDVLGLGVGEDSGRAGGVAGRSREKL